MRKSKPVSRPVNAPNVSPGNLPIQVNKGRMTRLLIGLGCLATLTASLAILLIIRRNASGAWNDATLVSRWGVRIYVTDESAYKTEYANGNNDITVHSSTGERLLAPGQEDQGGILIRVDGKPNVPAKLDINLIVGSEVYLTREDGTKYMPVVFTLSDNLTKETIMTGSLQEIADYFTAYSETALYPPDTYLTHELRLSWTWRWDDGDDALDTLLGDLADGKISEIEGFTDYCLRLDYTIAVTVTQAR